MRVRRSVGVCAAALAASMSASYAGPCSNDIGSMQAKINHKLAAIVAAGPPAPPSAMVGVAQPTPRSLGAVAERMGEISHETVQAIQQAMARARAADGAGDQTACDEALAEVEHILAQ